MEIEVKLRFGKKAEYTGFGRIGCSHGMYSCGGRDFYVYGIDGIIALEIDKRWGSFVKD